MRGTPSRFVVAACSAVALLAVTLFAPGCGDAYRFETSTDGATVKTSAAGSGVPPFLDLVGAAKDSTAYRGTRRIRDHRPAGVIELVEEVGTDGTGQFAVELAAAVTLTPEIDPISFPVQHASAARFHWRVRDFRLSSLSRALGVYAITLLPTPPPIAGVAVERVEFRRFQPVAGRPGHYEIDVDPETGVVLAWREFDATGQPLYESTFESFEYDGPTTDLNLRGRSFQAREFDLNGDLALQAGIPVLFPDVLPNGFEVVTGELMDVPAPAGASQNALLQPGPWIRFLADDGVETISFVHSEPMLQARTSPSEIKMIQMGGWQVGFGEYAGVRFAVAGRVDVGDLRRIVESAF